MLDLMRAEWLKISRRPMTLVLLGLFLGFMVFYFTIYFLAVGLHDGVLLGGLGSIQILEEAQIEQFRLQLRFPGVFGTVFILVNGIGGILGVVLAAGAMGSEYSWGTLRLQLARQPQRGIFLIAKIVVLLLTLLLGILISLVAGTLLGLIYGTLLENVGTVSMNDLLHVPLGIVRALYVMLPYILFTVAICTVGRSIIAGIAGGMIFLLMDASAGGFSFLADPDSMLTVFYNLVIQRNINTLTTLNSSSFGLDPSQVVAVVNPETLPSPLQAILVIGIYSMIFFGYSYYWLVYRDIPGPV